MRELESQLVRPSAAPDVVRWVQRLRGQRTVWCAESAGRSTAIRLMR